MQIKHTCELGLSCVLALYALWPYFFSKTIALA